MSFDADMPIKVEPEYPPKSLLRRSWGKRIRYLITVKSEHPGTSFP